MRQCGQRLGLAVISGQSPEILAATLKRLGRQTRAPEKTLVLAPTARALPEAMPKNMQAVLGPPGACALRNAALDILARECEIAILIDAGFFPSYDFIQKIAIFFVQQPRLAGALGRAISHGASDGSIAFEDADRILSAYEIKVQPPPAMRTAVWARPGPMAIRLAEARHLRFDENLPGEGHLAEADFSSRLAVFGRVVEAGHFAGVKCGEQQSPKFRARASLQRGYAQIANAAYLVDKGSLPAKSAYFTAAKTIAANLAKSLASRWASEPVGLAKGNWLALADLMRDDMHPKRILDF